MELGNRLLLLITGKTEKNILHVGTWNVRTLKQTGKLHLLIKELGHQHIDVTGLSEVRWAGVVRSFFSGAQWGRHGVAVFYEGQSKEQPHRT